jgi:hypothetical protein
MLNEEKSTLLKAFVALVENDVLHVLQQYLSAFKILQKSEGSCHQYAKSRAFVAFNFGDFLWGQL